LNKIILRKTNNAIFLAAILVAGTITAFFPSFMVGTAQAVPYPDMDREKKADKKSVSVSSLKCNNINVNVNGLVLDVFPPFLGGEDLAAEAVDDNTDTKSFAGNNGDNSASQINDFRFICINNNNNTVIEKEQTPASLTVKKQLFGCTPINQFEMNCSGLRNNSTEWLDCSNSSISNSIFCQSLPASIFDIELRDQNTQIQQFEGSTEGTVIQNLEPGTYIVNEIKTLPLLLTN
jgi:hypothetical protein